MLVFFCPCSLTWCFSSVLIPEGARVVFLEGRLRVVKQEGLDGDAGGDEARGESGREESLREREAVLRILFSDARGMGHSHTETPDVARA